MLTNLRTVIIALLYHFHACINYLLCFFALLLYLPVLLKHRDDAFSKGGDATHAPFFLCIISLTYCMCRLCLTETLPECLKAFQVILGSFLRLEHTNAKSGVNSRMNVPTIDNARLFAATCINADTPCCKQFINCGHSVCQYYCGAFIACCSLSIRFPGQKFGQIRSFIFDALSLSSTS